MDSITSLLKLKDCMMETFFWLEWGRFMSIGDPLTATRVRVGIKKMKSALAPICLMIPINLSGSSTFYGPNFEGIYGSISSDKNTI